MFKKCLVALLVVFVLSVSSFIVGCEDNTGQKMVMSVMTKPEIDTEKQDEITETDIKSETEELPTIEFDPNVQKRPEPVYPPNYVEQPDDVIRKIDELSDFPVFNTAEEALESEYVISSFERLEDILERYCAGEIEEAEDITARYGKEYENSRFAQYFTSREERTKFVDTLPVIESITYYPIVVDFVDNFAYYICGVAITNPEKACVE